MYRGKGDGFYVNVLTFTCNAKKIGTSFTMKENIKEILNVVNRMVSWQIYINKNIIYTYIC